MPESVREAEQRNPKTLRRELVDAIVEAYEDHNDDSEQFREVTGTLVSIHEQFIAKSATLRLAEQAPATSQGRQDMIENTPSSAAIRAELARLHALLEDRYEMADEILAFFRVERDQTLEKPVSKFIALALADRIRVYLKGQP